MIRMEIDQDLVEAAVHAAMVGRAEAGAFHRDRERCYTVPAAQRGPAFRTCFDEWFRRLGLEELLREVVAERPIVEREVALATVSAARRKRDQGIELYVADPERGTLGPEHRRLHIRILPEILVDRPAALAVLRPELLHVADMLDPDFGYLPQLPPSQTGPTHDRMLLDRYSALWSASVAGRMIEAGRMPSSERDRQLVRLVNVFPMLAERADTVFAPLLTGDRPTHDELVRFAIDPRGCAGARTSADPGSRCSLCACPTYSFEPPAALAAIADAIRRESPAWSKDFPVCTQCAELYRARANTGSASTSSTEVAA